MPGAAEVEGVGLVGFLEHLDDLGVFGHRLDERRRARRAEEIGDLGLAFRTRRLFGQDDDEERVERGDSHEVVDGSFR